MDLSAQALTLLTSLWESSAQWALPAEQTLHTHTTLQLPKPLCWETLEKPVPVGSLQHGRDPLRGPGSLWNRGLAACPAGQAGRLLLTLCLSMRGTG